MQYTLPWGVLLFLVRQFPLPLFASGQWWIVFLLLPVILRLLTGGDSVLYSWGWIAYLKTRKMMVMSDWLGMLRTNILDSIP